MNSKIAVVTATLLGRSLHLRRILTILNYYEKLFFYFCYLFKWLSSYGVTFLDQEHCKCNPHDISIPTSNSSVTPPATSASKFSVILFWRFIIRVCDSLANYKRSKKKDPHGLCSWHFSLPQREEGSPWILFLALSFASKKTRVPMDFVLGTFHCTKGKLSVVPFGDRQA